MNKPPQFLPLSALLPITWKNNLSSIDVATSQQFVFVYSVTIKFEKHRINAHTTGTSICESENFKNSCEVMKFVLVPTTLGKVTCAWDIHLFYLGVGQKLDKES
jgi:hypothetical protein